MAPGPALRAPRRGRPLHKELSSACPTGAPLLLLTLTTMSRCVGDPGAVALWRVLASEDTPWPRTDELVSMWLLRLLVRFGCCGRTDVARTVSTGRSPLGRYALGLLVLALTMALGRWWDSLLSWGRVLEEFAGH